MCLVYICVCARERFYLKNYSMSYLLFWLTVVPKSILFMGVPCSDGYLIEESVRSVCVCVCVYICTYVC